MIRWNTFTRKLVPSDRGVETNLDVYEEYLTPDIAASRFLLTLASKRQKSSFNGILQFINTTLTQCPPKPPTVFHSC